MTNQLHDIDAEQSVLSAIMLDNSVLDDIRYKLKPESFRNSHHKLIYAAMLRLHDEQEPIDVITLPKVMQKDNALQKIGGSYYLMQISEKLPTSANVEHHAKIVSDYALARRVVRLCQTYQMFNGEMTIQEQVAKFREAVDEIDYIENGRMKSLLELVDKFESEDAYNAMTQSCITIGDSVFDSMVIVKPADIIFVAGRPSMGKTASMLSMALGAAENGNKPGIISIEMRGEYLLKRMAHSKSFELGYTGYKNGLHKIANLPIFIEDSYKVNLDYLNQQIGYNIRKHGLNVLFIDYLTLLEMPDANNMHQSVTQLSAGLKRMARKYNIPIFVLCQLSRKLEDRASKRPMLSDMRESGSIEQDADIVMFAYRPFVYESNSDKAMYRSKFNITEDAELNFFLLLVSKQRDGQLLDIKKFYKLDNQAFYPWDSYTEERDNPF